MQGLNITGYTHSIGYSIFGWVNLKLSGIQDVDIFLKYGGAVMLVLGGLHLCTQIWGTVLDNLMKIDKLSEQDEKDQGD